MTDFAPPLTKLGESGIGVAAAPSGGMGLALTPDGKIPIGVLFSDSTARRIDFGVSVLTYGGGTPIATATVTHDLGVAPACVVATGDTSTNAGYPNAIVGSLASTTFTISIHTTDGTSPAAATTANVYWIAIG